MTPDRGKLPTGAVAYEHLGRFSDWVEFGQEQGASFSGRQGAALGPAAVGEVLGFADDQPPADVRRDDAWERDGVVGEEISWSVGYGPRTRGWFLRPAGAQNPLPGVLALHDHGGFKFFGKEKIADGHYEAHPSVRDLRDGYYGGRAFANDLAKEGFAVLAHDVFLWGSRRFSSDEISASGITSPTDEQPRAAPVAADDGAWGEVGDVDITTYNRLAAQHEHLVAKYCTLLGTSLAGVVAYEDRVALGYLKSRPDVDSDHLGCIGLSGGGCRAALLQATCADISVSVIVDMMSTYGELLDRHVAGHTWMFFPPGLVRLGDWPDLAACRAPSPLVVQYSRQDQLFSLKGMTAAHKRLGARYLASGAPDKYIGRFYDGPHQFDRAMQADAFEQLKRWLST
jgi:dienelactone hydrolase